MYKSSAACASGCKGKQGDGDGDTVGDPVMVAVTDDDHDGDAVGDTVTVAVTDDDRD